MKILVFQHISSQGPELFCSLWQAKGHEWTTVQWGDRTEIPEMDEFDLLVVTGGPMDVWQHSEFPWLAAEKAAIRHWVQTLGRPYLGICLGHQLLADALGGAVTPMRVPEIGIADVELTTAGQADPIFAGFDRRFEALNWHGAEVSRLPDGAILLARNESCEVQAFRWGMFAYGLQYNTEVVASTVSGWTAIPEYKGLFEEAFGVEGAAVLASQVTARLPMFALVTRRTDDNVAKLVFEHGSVRGPA